jgi:hypothetical protein
MSPSPTLPNDQPAVINPRPGHISDSREPRPLGVILQTEYISAAVLMSLYFPAEWRKFPLKSGICVNYPVHPTKISLSCVPCLN